MSAATEIATVIKKAKPRERGPCHLVDHRGYAVCGAFRNGTPGGTHSHAECKARGHKLCVPCKELDRQLGGNDNRMVA